MSTVINGFETARLVVSPVQIATVSGADLAAIVTPDVTQYLPPELIASPSTDPASWLHRLCARADVYAVNLQGNLIGFLTLHPVNAQSVMIGYLFAKHAWGQGFASELVQGLLAAYKSTGWRGTLTGGVEPENKASAAVLIKAGFRKADTSAEGPEFYEIQI